MYITKDNKKEVMIFLGMILSIYIMILYNMLSFSSIYSNLIQGNILYLTFEYALICFVAIYLLYNMKFNAIIFWVTGTLSFVPLIFENEYFYIVINWVVTVHLALFAKMLYEWYLDYQKCQEVPLIYFYHLQPYFSLKEAFHVKEIKDRLFFQSKDNDLEFYIEDMGNGDIGIRDVGYIASLYNLSHLSPMTKIKRIKMNHRKTKAIFQIIPFEDNPDTYEIVLISSKSNLTELIHYYVSFINQIKDNQQDFNF